MLLIRNLKQLKSRFKKPIVTIGMFDGVHLAHQRIIQKAVKQAQSLKGTSVVLTFSFHPAKILKKWPNLSLITSLEHRIELIKRLKVDICLVLEFNKKFSQMPAEYFIKHVLVDIIGIKYLIVGADFRFGKNKSGRYSLLRKLSKVYGFKLRKVNPIKVNGRIISSSKIRALIQKGKINQASRLLGRKFSILGKVKRGSARGRILGYPTANIAPFQEIVPLGGVYAVFVKLNNKLFSGILNIGKRPTFEPKKDSPETMEVHLFSFRQNIYGRNLEVFFIQRIRGEKKFTSRKQLIRQIKKDELQAKTILKARRLLPNKIPV